MSGSVAVELALILMALWFILTATFVFGRIFWQYSLLKNATYSAARYLASPGTWAELKTGPERRKAAEDMVKHLAQEGGIADLDVAVSCWPSIACGGSSFTTITVGADFYPVPFPLPEEFLKVDLLSANSTVGNTN